NLALETIQDNWDNLVAGGAAVSEETKLRYIAEVKFLRAWYYFDLLWVFKEVPLVVNSMDPETRLPKNSIEDIRLQIFSDLDEAIAVASFPRSAALPRSEKGPAHKDAAYTLKARGALFSAGLLDNGKLRGDAAQEYRLAPPAAERVIKKGNLRLLPAFQDWFRGH